MKNDTRDDLKVEITISSDQIRQIGTRARGALGAMTTKQAEAFLVIHGSQLHDSLLQTITGFVVRKLS